MKILTKILSLILVLTLSSSILAGCAVDELSLLNAICRKADITSCESKTELTVSLTSEGLKGSEKETFNQLATLINGTKLVINQKMKSNPEKTISKSQSDFQVDLGGISASASLWADVDLSGDTPRVKEVIKLPAILTMLAASEQAGKDYLVLDMEDLTAADSTPVSTGSTKEILEFSKGITSKLTGFLKGFAGEMDPGFSIVTRKETKIVDYQLYNVYNLKLDDDTFKKLLSYTVTKFAQSETALNFVKDLIKSSITLSDISDQEKLEATSEIDESFEEFKAEIPGYLKSWDTIMGALKDVKILGDKGIDIDFTVNGQGFIVNEHGSLDFVIDTKAITNALMAYSSIEDFDYAEDSSVNQGIIKLGFTFNTDYSNINKDVAIDFPLLTPENSYKFSDLGLFNSGLPTNVGEEFEEDTVPPAPPVVDKVLKTSKTVTGTAEAFSIVTVKKGTTVLGQEMADEKGVFSVSISPVKTPCTLTVTAMDLYGNESKPATVNVN
ncbi:hypothetical protein CLHUN_04480 [Ruminiclostridium hungatei]|uniref:Bacterial Ig domain-containing protein n=1 Tax=Ruminiclostridium hungatei TaxID=48256 RepID=A0A1V4SQC3_RUMHU|nr:Ig-like domain-containing protein [Ruminiclostridium hungatei]OPX45973.1 hypothetical protein CLHUN_04480 [Ruminiclostridium hungatei]